MDSSGIPSLALKKSAPTKPATDKGKEKEKEGNRLQEKGAVRIQIRSIENDAGKKENTALKVFKLSGKRLQQTILHVQGEGGYGMRPS